MPSLPPLHDIPLTLSTSGTTGTGSRVPKTLGAMLRESTALLTLPHWPHSATALGSVHPQHFYGLTFRTIHSLLAGWHIDPTHIGPSYARSLAQVRRALIRQSQIPGR